MTTTNPTTPATARPAPRYYAAATPAGTVLTSTVRAGRVYRFAVVSTDWSGDLAHTFTGSRRRAVSEARAAHKCYTDGKRNALPFTVREARETGATYVESGLDDDDMALPADERAATVAVYPVGEWNATAAQIVKREQRESDKAYRLARADRIGDTAENIRERATRRLADRVAKYRAEVERIERERAEREGGDDNPDDDPTPPAGAPEADEAEAAAFNPHIKCDADIVRLAGERDAALRELRERAFAHDIEAQAHIASIDRLTRERDTLQAEADRLRTERDEARAEVKQLRVTLDAADGRRREDGEEMMRQRRAIESLAYERDHAERELHRVKTLLGEARRDVEAITSEHRAAQSRADNLNRLAIERREAAEAARAGEAAADREVVRLRELYEAQRQEMHDALGAAERASQRRLAALRELHERAEALDLVVSMIDDNAGSHLLSDHFACRVFDALEAV